MLLSRMSPTADGFHCRSCNHATVDFRGLSPDEIREKLRPGMCGIFTADQIPAQRALTGRGLRAFRLAVVLSFFGFRVAPVAAADGPLLTPPPAASVTTVDADDDAAAVDRDDRPRRKRLFHRFRRNKVKGYVTGCPKW
jgi:hypothetical protein